MARVIIHPAFQPKEKGKKQSMPIVKSEFLQNVEYDADNLQMTVTMKNGSEYIYSNVYPSVMDDFIKASSKGKFYAQVLRGRNPSTRIVDKTVGPQIKTNKRR